MKTTGLILAGDVGGTKTYLGLFEVNGHRPRAVRVGRFINAQFRGIGDVTAAFLSDARAAKGIRAGVFGVACPVERNRGRLTNSSWNVDGRALGKRFGIKKFELINDVKALGYGALLLSKRDFFIIHKGRAKPVTGGATPAGGAASNAALIAAGTGLGEAILFWNNGARVPSESEGGHADFAPQSALEIELFNFLRKKYGHVSCERIVSGQGLHDLYRFFSARQGGSEPERIRKRFIDEKDRAAVIFDEAVKHRDKNCVKAFRLFVSIYGAEAGNLALKAMAAGGVYLGGGIAPKVFARKEAAAVFMKSFSAKGRFKNLLETFPVYVIRNERTALCGAAFYAQSLLRGRP